MSNPEAKAFAAGSLFGTIFTYNEGDELPVHVHDEGTNHITIIMSGSFRCTGNAAIEGRVLSVGNVIDWPAHEPHGFVALEPSRMLQISKG